MVHILTFTALNKEYEYLQTFLSFYFSFYSHLIRFHLDCQRSCLSKPCCSPPSLLCLSCLLSKQHLLSLVQHQERVVDHAVHTIPHLLGALTASIFDSQPMVISGSRRLQTSQDHRHTMALRFLKEVHSHKAAISGLQMSPWSARFTTCTMPFPNLDLKTRASE